mgnify:CR=1 FL=1
MALHQYKNTGRNRVCVAGDWRCTFSLWVNATPIPADAHGIQTDLLDSADPIGAVYVTPSHQYPLGSVLSLERRLHLLNLIEASGGWLIEDDYDSDFNHAQPGARPLPAIQGLRPDAPVIYVGTFSKLLYPGLRIAYLVVPRWAVADIGEAIHNLYRGGQAVEQRALARFLEAQGVPVFSPRSNMFFTWMSTRIPMVTPTPR